MNKFLIATLSTCFVFVLQSFSIACITVDRDVELRVTILDPDQKPISLVGVCAHTTTERPCATTNEAGVAKIAAKLAPGQDRVPIELVWSPGANGQTMRRITSTMAVSYTYWVDVSKNATSADTTIQLGRAVQVSGRVLNPDGTPAKGNACVRNMRALSILDKEGRFVLPVVPGILTELHFGILQDVAWVVPLPPASADLDLGEIKVVQVPSDAIVRINLANEGLLQPMVENRGGGIALISTDGKVIRRFAVKAPGFAVANVGTGELPKVPAGTYYVTPGLFGNTPSYKVLDLIRADRQAELDKAGVPKITAVADKETSLTINLPEAEAAFDKLPEVPPEQRKPQPPSK